MSDNKLDDSLQIGAACDWISPLYAILRDAAHDGSVTHFGVNAYGGFDRGAIRRLLSTNDIESWGYLYNVAGDLIMFSVPEAQAQAAYDVMALGGVPVLYVPTTVSGNETQPAPARPSVALGNTFHAGGMKLVKAPSVWGLLKRLLG